MNPLSRNNLIVWEKYESLLLICGYKMGINVFENLDPIGCAKAIIVTGCFARITGIIEEMDIFALYYEHSLLV